MGQLVDGVKGMDTLDTDERRFSWVGWTTPPQEVALSLVVHMH